MGGGGSQTIEQVFNMSAVNKSIYNQITNNTQKVSGSQTNIQKMTLNIGGSMIACPYTSSQKRVIRNYSHTAKERYLHFKKTYPYLDQRIPQYMIASYLGVTKEFFSKMKSSL